MLNVERKPISFLLCFFFFRPIISVPRPFLLYPFPLPVFPECCGHFPPRTRPLACTHNARHTFQILSYSRLKSIMYRYVRRTCRWLFNTLLLDRFRLFSSTDFDFLPLWVCLLFLTFRFSRSRSSLALVNRPRLFPVSDHPIY